MNIWIILLILLGIILVVAIAQNGIEGFKASPLQSSWESTKTIAIKSKDTFVMAKDIISDNSTNSLKNLGLPLCQNNDDCLTLSECKDNHVNCTCDISSGECFLTS